jgi:hypothetical protein
MNGELPPVDPGIREQLARRSAGRLPEGLLADVSAAVDAVSVERPARFRLGPVAMGAPRLAAAGSLALVFVIAAALVVVPRFMTSPAGNTTYTALTTPELASLLANKTQPAVNATLVATVTVDSRNDVCPMNRYPTLGVIEGMGSLVCVMGVDLTAYLSADRLSSPKVTGTFAFRYLAPGYLGLIGQLTLPATGLTFRATDDWPLQGRTFLVEGWLGADGLTGSCIAPTAGDVLLPDGGDCPYDNWLGTESTAPGIAADHVTVANSPEPTYDPLSLRGNARHVEAGGVRIIDSIDHAAPVHGVYVVRSVTEGCPNASPIDSRGCGYWRVLARVSDTSLHAPTATATPTPAPTGVYPTSRALTTDELARLLAGPQPAINTALVASVTIDPQPDACPMNSRPTYGVIHGIEPQICVVGPIGDTGSVATGQNVFAFRYMGPGVLGLLGLIQPASASKLAFAVADDWSQAGKVFLVEGWLGADPFPCPTYVPTDGGDPLNPDGSDQCELNWMSDQDPDATPSPDASNGLPVPKRLVDAGGMRLVDDIPSYPAVHGVYVVRFNALTGCTGSSGSVVGCGRVLAKVADVTLPKASPSPTQPPATPLTTAGSYPDGRPLTTAELGRAMAAGIPTDQIVVVQASLGTGAGCATVKGYAPIGTLAGISPDVCVVGITDGKAVHSPAATSGVFAFRVLDNHTLGFMASIEVAGTDRLTYQGNEPWPAGKTILVSGWLAAGSSIYFCGNMGAVIPEPLDPGGVECGDYWISDQHPQPAGPVYSPQPVPTGFQRVSLPDYPDVGGGLLPHEARATYLVRDEARCDAGASPTDQAVNTTWDKLCGWQIMARVDPLTVPAEPALTAAPPATPIATPTIPNGGPAVGLFGDGNRPLTEAELAALWAADPAHLVGWIAIIKGPVPTGLHCSDIVVPASPRTCGVPEPGTTIAPDGYWAVRVGA